jgi:putative glutamine amidotransferase
MSRPIIGLTTYAEQVRYGAHEAFAALLPMSYIRAVHRCGGRAVLLTQDDPGADALRGLDGLILTGGPDADPALYHEPPHPATIVRPARDRAELLLLREALHADLPVLGICRGMQLMAVEYGGRLHQHLPDLLGHDGHRPNDGARFPGRPVATGEHQVRLAAGSRCHQILGGDLVVNSFHHQAVADPGRLTAVGWCPDDDLVEAVEDPRRTFALGVQWHPEQSDDHRLFAALVDAAALSGREGGAQR